MNENLVQTLQAHYNAKFLRARTNFDVYLTSAVGVGEHGDIVEEALLHLEEMEKSRSCVQLLQEMINVSKQNTSTDKTE